MIKKNSVLLIFILITGIFESRSQNFSWQHFQSYSDVNSIIEAGDSMWIGTTGGIAIIRKSDSTVHYLNNSNCGLKDNCVTALERAINGNIWIGTKRGNLFRYDGSNWTQYNSTNTILPGMRIADIHADSSGIIWVASGYLYRFDGMSWQGFYMTNTGESLFDISCITSDWNHHLWVGTSSTHKVLEYNGVHWTRWDTTAIPYAPLWWIDKILCDKNGNIWFSAPYLYERYFNHFTQAQSPSPSMWNYTDAHKFAVDSLNRFWIPWNHGFIMYVHDSVNNLVYCTWYNQNFSPDLNKLFRCITADKNNCIWFGGYNKGVISFKDSLIASYPMDPSIPGNWVRDFAFDHGGSLTWIATGDGLSKFSNNVFTTYYMDSLPWFYNSSNYYYSYYGDIIQALSIQNTDFLWVATPYFAMYYFNLNDPPIIPLYPSQSSISTLFTDSLGIKWIGSGNGTISRFNSDTLSYTFDTFTYFTIPGFTNFDTTNRINAISSLPGTPGIEIATELQGLGQFDGTTFSVYDTSNSFLPTNRINAITHDKFGNRWLGSDKGIIRFNPPFVSVWDSANTPIPENFITALEFDYRGRLWAGTRDHGLIMYNDTTWYNYTMANSVLPGDWVLCIKEDPMKRIWVGTDNGLAMIEDSLLTTTKQIQKPAAFALGQNYPNPANSYTQFSISGLQTTAQFIIKDLTGRTLQTIRLKPGTTSVKINTDELSAGLYIAELKANGISASRKLQVIH